MFYIITF